MAILSLEKAAIPEQQGDTRFTLAEEPPGGIFPGFSQNPSATASGSLGIEFCPQDGHAISRLDMVDAIKSALFHFFLGPPL